MSTYPVRRAGLAEIERDRRLQLPEGFRRFSTRVGAVNRRRNGSWSSPRAGRPHGSRCSRRLFAASIACVGVLTGCGSGLRVPDGGFHSSSHQYSARQVEAVFAKQGIRLRDTSPRGFDGSIALLDGRPAHRVWVLVLISGKGGAQPEPFSGTETQHGNVTVLSRSRDAGAVTAALRDLD
jgi:hypothetical protein